MPEMIACGSPLPNPRVRFASAESGSLYWADATSGMNAITNEGMTDCCQMDADLVRASGLQLDAEKRAIPVASQRCDVRGGSFSLLAHAEGNRSHPRNRCVDRLRFGELAFAKREVTLSNALRFKESRERGIDGGQFGKEHDAGGAAIETLHEIERIRVRRGDLE